MVEPTTDPGVQLFGIVIITMTLCAGVASLPPARNFRIFVAAATLFGLWIINLFFREALSIFASHMLFLDMMCAYLFYKLSVPNKKSKTQDARAYDWAAYLCLIFIAITIFEFIDLLLITDLDTKYVWASLFLLFCGVVAWGFFRGFGILAGVIFVGALAGFAALAGNLFSLTINLMTLAAYGTIICFSIPPIRANLTAWAIAVMRAVKPDDDRNHSELVAGVKVNAQASKKAQKIKISDR